MRNRLRAIAFLLLLDVALVSIGFMIGGREGLLWLLFISLSINFLLYFYSDTRVLNLFDIDRLGGHKIAGPDGWGVFNHVQSLSLKLRIPVPRILKVELKSPQILVTGTSEKRATIIITDGFLGLLEPNDQKALLAYAMMAIKTNQVLLFGLLGSFISFFEILFNGIDKFIRFLIGTKQDHWSGHLTYNLLIPFIFFGLRVFINSSEYYKLDADTKNLLADPKDLGRALQKVDAFSYTLPLTLGVSLAHFFVVNPLTSRSLNKWIKFHPRIEKRIEKLVGCYPI